MNDQSRVLLEGMDDSMDYYYSTYTTTSITTQWELQSLHPSSCQTLVSNVIMGLMRVVVGISIV